MVKRKRITKVSLRTRLAWPSTLYQAFEEVTKGANPDSAGPDGVTIDLFRRSAKTEIARLKRELLTDNYLHSLGRGVAISKKAGVPISPATARPITVFNVRDRIVQRAIANIIW